jgi:glycosyltransferase involved in cell wall biosynthesis
MADLVMPVSKFLQQSIEDCGIEARFCVVPNAVDTRLFHPNLNTKAKERIKRLLIVCGLSSYIKGLPYLFDALVMLRLQREDWHLDIVGDGELRKGCECAVSRLGIAEKITFHGLKTKQEVAEFMRKADIFVLPSILETFSVVTIEALAVGLPVIATRCGGPEEIITRDVGLLVPAKDVAALCEGIDYMLSNLKHFSAEHISNYSVSLFSLERIGEQFHAIYLQQLANGKMFKN